MAREGVLGDGDALGAPVKRSLVAFVACASCASPAALPPTPVIPVTVTTATPAPTFAPEPSKKSAPCPAGMALLPEGGFAMTDRGDVHVDAFCMDVTEVTAAAYARCVDAARCSDEGLVCEDVHTYRVAGKEDHPMNCVTPEQAQAFCNANGKRLPTSMEWEWAARGAERGWAFPWGDAEPTDTQICWRRRETCAVGAHPADASPHGILDLAGNLVEYTSTLRQGSSDPEYRGGSWAIHTASFVRADNASGTFGSERRGDAMGFRCVASAR